MRARQKPSHYALLCSAAVSRAGINVIGFLVRNFSALAERLDVKNARRPNPNCEITHFWTKIHRRTLNCRLGGVSRIVRRTSGDAHAKKNRNHKN